MGAPAVQRPPCQPLVASGAIDHHVADLSMTAAGDVTLGALQARLAAHGQWLPIDGDPARTLADLVMLNSTGPLRLGYGAWRDLLLGCQFRGARGDLITAGGRTVKNVAGYDLTKLMIGHGGRLGQVITITTRTYRRPAAAILARFAPQRDVPAALIATPLRPQWALRTAEATLCGYLSDERTIDYYAGALPGVEPLSMERRAPEADAADRAALWPWPPRRGDAPAARLAVPPAQVPEVMRRLSPRPAVADAAFGVIVVAGIDQPAAQALNLRGVWSDGAAAHPLGLSGIEREIIDRLKEAL
jgi:FAD/FMN-containing dehydrogenase